MRTICLLVALVAVSACESKRVGYVDLQKALDESEEWKTTVDEIRKDVASKSKEVTKLQDEADKAEKDKSPDAKVKRDTANALVQRYNREIDERRQNTAQAVVARLNRIVPKIAEERRLDAVVPMQAMLTISGQQPTSGVVQTVSYVSPGSDLTAELVRRANRGEGAENPKQAQLNAAEAKVAELKKQLREKDQK